MKIDDIEVLLTKEWEVISTAPIIFLASCLFIGSITWIFWKLIYNRQVTILRDRLNLKDDQIEILERTLELSGTQRTAQRLTFAYGNAKVDINRSTLEEVSREAELLGVEDDTET